MHAALTAITDELRRLKAAGLKSVPVSEESLASLRRAVEALERTQPSTTEVPVEAPAAAPALGAPAAPAAPTPRRNREVDLCPGPEELKLPPGDKSTRMAWLREHVLQHPVCTARIPPGRKGVLGVGSLDARIFFCGEAPGAEEEVQGEPFVGPAGQLLTRMIQGMGLSRDDVYIGNIMTWRPQLPTPPGATQVGNRPPRADEMAFCLPFLKAQLEIVNPEVIVALGATAAQALLGSGSFKALGEVRGKWKDFEGKPLMITYHPSYILRNSSNRSKRVIWEDLLQVMEKTALPISERQRNFFLER